MYIDTTKMKSSGQEIFRLSNLISDSMNRYYSLVNQLTNEAWTGVAATQFKNNVLKYKTVDMQLVNNLKSEANLLINFSTSIENKLNSLKR